MELSARLRDISKIHFIIDYRYIHSLVFTVFIRRKKYRKESKEIRPFFTDRWSRDI